MPCGVCHGPTSAPVNMDKIFKFATFDKKSFLPGLEDSDVSKSKVFPLCGDCYRLLSEGRNVIDAKFLDAKSVYKVKIYTVPELLMGNVNRGRLEEKIHDLDLTRTISLQITPQIHMVQSNDTEITEKIQSTLTNTLPLWKNQMVIALGLAHSQEAARVQHTVTETTNELLRKNADNLKMATIATAKEFERGMVDIETLKHTNEQLIFTIDEATRSEERRVGKECRSRWSPYH